jgi:hypothetical protein
MANVKFEYSGKLSDGRFFDEDSKKKVVFDLEDSDLTVDEMLDEFMNFMQAIGYKFEIGDRFAVVNDFKEFEEQQKQEKQESFKFDFSKYDPIVDEGGGIIGAAAKLQPIKTVSDEALSAEVERLRSITAGLSEEALNLAAWNNLANRGV